MEIKISKKTLKEWVQLYYQKYLGISVKVSMSSRIELVGFYETEDCVVTTKVKKKVEILGTTVEETEMLSKEDLQKICAKILEETNYCLESFVFNKDIKETWQGYGFGEHLEKSSVFCGAILTVQPKNLENDMSLQRKKTYF